MDRLGGITKRRVVIALTALIVVGGFVLALLSSSGFNPAAPSSSSTPFQVAGGLNGLHASATDLQGGLMYGSSDANIAPGNTVVIGQMTTVTMTATSTTTNYGQVPPQGGANASRGSPASGGGLIEFSSDLAIRSSTPQRTASEVVALAYSVGGYVAYQSTFSDSAYVVIRVPAAEYQLVLNRTQGMGTVLSLTSNSNDVSVQYTDLNATLASLRTEQGSLLRLLNQSSTINSTLAVETQLQLVDQQINQVQSQILQTRTLIAYSTIDVTISKTAQATPLAMTLSATPINGTAPLSVTFNAIVKGGAQPYVVNYNFGDGYASQGQLVIHTYFQAGTYRVVTSATDQNGTVVQSTATVRVDAVQAQSGLQTFFGNVASLFINVVEGIVEVAVVVLPLAAVGAAIILPIERRGRAQKSVKQGQ